MPEYLHTAVARFTGLSLAWKLGVLAVGLVLVVGLAWGARSLVKGAYEWKASYDEQKRAQGRAEDRAIRNAAIKRAEAAEAKAEVHEQTATVWEEVAKKGSAKAKALDAEMEEIDAEYKRKEAATGMPADPFERWERVCGELRRLGYPCPPKPGPSN